MTGFYAFFVFKPDHDQRHYMTKAAVKKYSGGISCDKSEAWFFESEEAALAAITKTLKTFGTGAPQYAYTPGTEDALSGDWKKHISL